MHMFMAFFRWWYTDGWERQVKQVQNRLYGLIDTFSIDLIIRTLFAPFRQISAGRVSGPIGQQFRAFIDRLISRGIGAMVRLMVLFTGCIVIAFATFTSLLYLLVWPFLPALPVIGVILTLQGWIPWR